MVGHVAAGARYWRSQLHACYFYHQKKAKSACLCLANLNESTFFCCLEGLDGYGTDTRWADEDEKKKRKWLEKET